MSRDSAKAHYSKQPGDPDEGFITASDAQAAIDDIYDDMAGPAVIADGSVTSGKIAADAVGSAQIATGAVGSGELATDAVTSDKIADGAVSNAHVASDAAIAASKVAGTAVTQADTGTVTNGMLAGSIAKGKIAGTAITAADSGTVTGSMIASGAVDNGNLAANAVNAAKIASGAVTTVKIEDDAVTTAKIAADAVGASELADNAVDTAAIQDGAVTYAKLGSDVRIGNLLTANQASGTDTLGTTAGFVDAGGGGALSSVWDPFGSGSRAIKCAATGAAFQGIKVAGLPTVSNPGPMTWTVTVRVTTTGTYRWGAYSPTAGVNTITTGTLTAGSWVTLQQTFTTTAPASDLDLFIDTGSGGGITGDIYCDAWGLWAGAGGQWAMPGQVIPGTSHIADNGAFQTSGTVAPEGVITAPPLSRYLQTSGATTATGAMEWVKASGTGNTGWVAGAEADTGWRNVMADIDADWEAAYVVPELKIRRVGSLVNVAIGIQRKTASGYRQTWDLVYQLPNGFTRVNIDYAPYGLALNINHGYIGAASANGAFNYIEVAFPGDGSGTWTAGEVVRSSFTYTTTDPWPSSLPGSAA